MNIKAPWRREDERKSSSKVEANAPQISDVNCSYWNCLHSLSILFACILYTSVLTLFPRHNTILYPNYWYELLMLFVGISVRNSALTVTELYIFTNEKAFLSFDVAAKSFIQIWLLFSVPYCICYLIWTNYFGYHHPMPFIGAICGMVHDLSMLIAFWLLIPSNLKTKGILKSQIKFYVLFRIWMVVLIVQANALQTISRIISSNFQWILSLLIPASVTGNSLVVAKIARNVPATNVEMLNNLVEITIMVVFTVFVTTRMSTLNETTVYSILVIEFGIHLKELYDIIKVHKKIKEASMYDEHILCTIKKEKVEMLILSEFIEGIAPLAFAIGFATAYYGFNSNLIRNVHNNYYGGEVIENVEHFYTVMFQMFSIEVIAMILSAGVLYYYCKINFFKEFCIVMKKYWVILIVKLPVLAMHFGYNDINFGLDYTMKFLWITDQGRLELIQDDVNLSELEKAMLINNTFLMPN